MGKKDVNPKNRGISKPANAQRVGSMLANITTRYPSLLSSNPTFGASTEHGLTGVEASNIDNETRTLLKRLWKKDGSTKCKALHELSCMVVHKSEDEIREFLPHWLQIFPKLSEDADRRTREATFRTQGRIGSRAGGSLSPFMKEILPALLMGQYDPYKPCALAARDNLELIFPSNRRDSLYEVYFDEVLFKTLVSIMLETCADQQSSVDADEFCTEERKFRRLASSLNSIYFICRSGSSGTKSHYVCQSLCNLVRNPKFIALSSCSDKLCKNAFYQLLIFMIGLGIVEAPDSILDVLLSQLAKSHEDNQVCVWEALVALLRANPLLWLTGNEQAIIISPVKSALSSSKSDLNILPFLLDLYNLNPRRTKFLPSILHATLGSIKSADATHKSSQGRKLPVLFYHQLLRYHILYDITDSPVLLEFLGRNVIPIIDDLSREESPISLSSSWSDESGFNLLFWDLLVFLQYSARETGDQSALERVYDGIFGILGESIASENWTFVRDFLSYFTLVDERQDQRNLMDGEYFRKKMISLMQGFQPRVTDDPALIKLFVALFISCGDLALMMNPTKVFGISTEELLNLCYEDPSLTPPGNKLVSQLIARHPNGEEVLAVISKVQERCEECLPSFLDFAETNPTAETTMSSFRTISDSNVFARFMESLSSIDSKWSVVRSCLSLGKIYGKLQDSVRDIILELLVSSLKTNAVQVMGELQLICGNIDLFFECFRIEDIDQAKFFRLTEALLDSSVGSLCEMNENKKRLIDTWEIVIDIARDGGLIERLYRIIGSCVCNASVLTAYQRKNLVDFCTKSLEVKGEKVSIFEVVFPGNNVIDDFGGIPMISDWFESASLDSLHCDMIGDGPLVVFTDLKRFRAFISLLSEFFESAPEKITSQLDITGILFFEMIEHEIFGECSQKNEHFIQYHVKDRYRCESLFETISQAKNIPCRHLVLDHILKHISSSCGWLPEITSSLTGAVQEPLGIDESEALTRFDELLTLCATHEWDVANFARLIRLTNELPLDSMSERLPRLLQFCQGFRGEQPESFDSSKPNKFQLCVISLFIDILQKGVTTEILKSHWDFILLTLTSMTSHFRWSDLTIFRERIATGVALRLCKVLVIIFDIVGQREGLLPEGVRQEWLEFYQHIVTEPFILFAISGGAVLNQIPDEVLSAITKVYTRLDACVIKNIWTKLRQTKNIDEVLIDFLSSQASSMKLAAQYATYMILLTVAPQETLDSENGDEKGGSLTYWLNEASSSDIIGIPESYLDPLKDYRRSTNIMLEKYRGKNSLYEISETDSRKLTGHILTSLNLLSYCSRSGRERRPQLYTFLEEHKFMKDLLEILSCITTFTVAPTKYSVEPHLTEPRTLEALTHWTSVEICFKVPGIVRSWFLQAEESKEKSSYAKYLIKFVSPVVINRQLSTIWSRDVRMDNMTLSVLPSTREIQANYVFQEIGRSCEISIQMDVKHPLEAIRIIDNTSTTPVSETKWRQWLLQLTIFLNSDNGSILEGLVSWKANLDSQAEGGTEECCICFSVIHMSTLKVPRYPCRTCKKRFHKACMYKWFKQGHATCPLCRTVLD